jgi:rare lipoprotein A
VALRKATGHAAAVFTDKTNSLPMIKPLLFLFATSLAGSTLRAADAGTHQRGKASWYGRECRSTASGERYDPSSMTAAHRTLPFGTMVRVTNLNAKRSAVVRINNRGPFKKGRIIDVSKAAAQQLAMMSAGVVPVSVEVIGK